MAAVTIRELLTKLGVDADTVAVQNFDKSLAIAKKTMVVATAAATALTAALVATTVATARQGDEAGKAAARVGIGAEAYQELGFAAQQTGAQIGDVELALRNQARTSDEAAQGMGEAAKSYRRLGLEASDVSKLQDDQLALLGALADGFKGLATDQERTALAQDVFGRSGTKLVPLLKLGAEGIAQYRKEAQELGFVLDKDVVKASEDFTDRMNEARLVVVGLRNQIGKQLIPVMTEMLAGFRDWVRENRLVINQRIDRTMDRIRKAVALVRFAIQRADTVVRERMGGWGNIIDQIEKVGKFTAFTGGLAAVIKLLQAASFAMAGLSAAGAPVVLVIGAAVVAFIAAALALDDLATFARGGESAIGAFLEAMDPALAVELRAQLNALAIEVQAIGDLFREVGLPLEELIPIINFVFGKLLLGQIKRMTAELQIFLGFLRAIPAVLDALGSPIRKLAKMLIPLLEAMERFGGLDTSGTRAGLQAVADFSLVDQQAEARGRRERDARGSFSSRFAGARGAMGAAATSPAGGTTNSQSTVVNQAGDTITINAPGMTPAEIEVAMNNFVAAKNRRAIAATAGGER